MLGIVYSSQCNIHKDKDIGNDLMNLATQMTIPDKAIKLFS